MTIVRGSSGEAGRAEVALARILPEGGRSCTDSWSPRSPGRPGWEDAFSGPGSRCRCRGSSGSVIDRSGAPGGSWPGLSWQAPRPGSPSAGQPAADSARRPPPLSPGWEPAPPRPPGPRPSPAPPPLEQPSPRGALAADRSRGPRRGGRARAAGNTDRLRGSAKPPPLQLPLPPPQGPGAAEPQSGENGASDCVDEEPEAQGKCLPEGLGKLLSEPGPTLHMPHRLESGFLLWLRRNHLVTSVPRWAPAPSKLV